MLVQGDWILGGIDRSDMDKAMGDNKKNQHEQERHRRQQQEQQRYHQLQRQRKQRRKKQQEEEDMMNDLVIPLPLTRMERGRSSQSWTNRCKNMLTVKKSKSVPSLGMAAAATMSYPSTTTTTTTSSQQPQQPIQQEGRPSPKQRRTSPLLNQLRRGLLPFGKTRSSRSRRSPKGKSKSFRSSKSKSFRSSSNHRNELTSKTEHYYDRRRRRHVDDDDELDWRHAEVSYGVHPSVIAIEDDGDEFGWDDPSSITFAPASPVRHSRRIGIDAIEIENNYLLDHDGNDNNDHHDDDTDDELNEDPIDKMMMIHNKNKKKNRKKNLQSTVFMD